MAIDRITSPGSARRRLALSLAVVSVAAVHCADAPARPDAPATTTRVTTREDAATYGWPVRPFREQHPVRGFFGDPRIGMTPQGRRSTFHFGVDVSAPNGSAVYATIDGVVVRWPHRPETVGVRSADGRTEFQYWHVAPSVAAGERVRAYRTVVGHVEAPWAHVHFSELRDGVYLNPLRRGAMGPYEDGSEPRVKSLRVERSGRPVGRGRIAGAVDLVAEALDVTPLPVPAPWTSRPVTPAVLRWRLVDRRGRPATPWRTAADFRRSIPADSAFATVYARWTRQNHASRSGRYRFLLAHAWDSTTIADGAYVLVVAATDTRGNTGVGRFPVRIVNS
jgi:hypothetical protein